MPERIGRYEIRQRIAEGGSSLVYEAFDTELGRQVAVKHLLPRALESGLSSVARFKREARSLAAVVHPNVVKVLGGGEYDGGAFLVMEFVDGKNLRAWLAARPVKERILEVLLQAGEGLAAAHAADIVHRDFKPENVMVGHRRAVVIDFGLARRSPDAAPGVRQESVLTEPGVVLGTPEYMAPEQHLAGVTDPRTDQFAYCVTYYQALFGQRPFLGATVGELLRAQAAGLPARPPDRSVMPEHSYAALVRGLSVTPQKRWPSMDALLEHLRADEPEPEEEDPTDLLDSIMEEHGVLGRSKRGGSR